MYWLCFIDTSNTTFHCFIVRLVNGPTSYEGRVEVYHNGEWGTICDYGWDLNDAKVVCNELGYGNATNAAVGALYGQGRGRIWLNYVRCVGRERTVRNCSHRFWRYGNCENAGVKCTSGEFY